jgi:putative flippase GtrA
MRGLEQVARYLIVQVAAYGVDYGGFLIGIGGIGFTSVTANVLSKSTAGLVAYFLHRLFTFRSGAEGASLSEMMKYAALLSINLPVSSAALVFLERFFAPELAKFFADLLIVGANFVVSRHLIFRPEARNA